MLVRVVSIALTDLDRFSGRRCTIGSGAQLVALRAAMAQTGEVRVKDRALYVLT